MPSWQIMDEGGYDYLLGIWLREQVCLLACYSGRTVKLTYNSELDLFMAGIHIRYDCSADIFDDWIYLNQILDF